MTKKIITNFIVPTFRKLDLNDLRVALLNYIFAQQNNGDFFLKINASENNRDVVFNLENNIKVLRQIGIVSAQKSCKDLLDVKPLQAQIYLQALTLLEQTKKIYKCFCASVKFAVKMHFQNACPCLGMAPDKLFKKTAFGLPFIWKFKLNRLQSFTINDLCKGKINLSLANLNDFAITQLDGCYASIFTNFIDAWRMQISHQFQLESFLDVTTLELALSDAFFVVPPVFCHLPLVLDSNLTKSINPDELSIANILQKGVLPLTLCNFLLDKLYFKNMEPKNFHAIVNAVEFAKLRFLSAEFTLPDFLKQLSV